MKPVKLGNGDILRDHLEGERFPGTINELPSLTRQSDADSTDINKLMKHYIQSDSFPMPDAAPLFLDVTKMGDYRTAMDQVNEANELFMSLDPKTRARFYNDPALFLDFTSDPANIDELHSLGLIDKETADAYRPHVEAVPAPTPPNDTTPKAG